LYPLGAEGEALDALLLAEPIVTKYFKVKESFIDFGTPSFILEGTQEVKLNFLKAYQELRQRQLTPILRKRDGDLLLQVVRIPPRPPRKRKWNAILLAITIVTVAASGYFMTSDPLYAFLFGKETAWLGATLYVAALLMILAVHELGHKFTSQIHGVAASLPYFIPGPPFPYGFGTFGAVIIQEAPIPNRDHLFDIGFSGPIIGFVASLLMAVVGLSLSKAVPAYMVAKAPLLPAPLILHLLIQLAVDVPEGSIIVLHPVLLASWIGFLVTFLNLLPAGQLDGGHIVRALLGEKGHRAASIAAVIILVVTGYWPMALIVALMMTRGHPGPLDDVSPLSPGRKILALIAFIICFVSAVPLLHF